MKAQVHDAKQGVCQRWNFSLRKSMLGFVAFLKGEEKTTDISFQVSTPLNINGKGAAIPIKWKVFTEANKAADPVSQHSKNENAYIAASPASYRTQLFPNNRPTAVQLSAFTSSLWGKQIRECWNQLNYTQYCKGRGVSRNFWDSFLFVNTQPCPWHS